MVEEEQPESPAPISVGDWSMSDEREFMENLLCQRFNFFLVLFSLVLAASFTTQASLNRTVLLLIGAAICFAVWLTIYRAHVKHHWIMQALYALHDGHPAGQVNDQMKKLGRGRSFVSVSRLIGIYLPLSCVLILLTLGLLTAAGALPSQ